MSFFGAIAKPFYGAIREVAKFVSEKIFKKKMVEAIKETTGITDEKEVVSSESDEKFSEVDQNDKGKEI